MCHGVKQHNHCNRLGSNKRSTSSITEGYDKNNPPEEDDSDMEIDLEDTGNEMTILIRIWSVLSNKDHFLIIFKLLQE